MSDECVLSSWFSSQKLILDMVEVEAEMEVGRMSGQKIVQDLVDFCHVKGAEGVKEVGGRGRIKDIRMDVFLKHREKALKGPPVPDLLFARDDFHFLLVCLGEP